MGITGLLPSIRKAQWVKITHLKGSSFVIDGHCFLHAAALLNPRALILQNDVSGVVDAMVQMVSSILPYATFVSLVFDGGALPSKAFINAKRRQARDANLALAETYFAAGDSEEAINALRKAISFTQLQVSQIANSVFKKLDKYSHFAVMISPYEADAQIAYLQKVGLADVIVTNDSDILLYGPRKALYKYNWRTETGFLTVTDDLYCKSFGSLTSPKVPSRILDMLKDFNITIDPQRWQDRCTTSEALSLHLRFQQACILSGCDYVPSLVGVGLATSVNTVAKTDGIVSAAQLLRYGCMKKLPVDMESFEQYVKQVLQAYLTFRYHLVFDPLSFQVVPFYPYNEEDSQLINILDQWCYGAPFTSLEACLACMGIINSLPDTQSGDLPSPKRPAQEPIPAALQYSTIKEAQEKLRKRSTSSSLAGAEACNLPICTKLHRQQLDNFSDSYIDRWLRSLQRLHYAAARSALKKPADDSAFQCSTVLSLVAAEGLTLTDSTIHGSSKLYTDPINISSYWKPFSHAPREPVNIDAADLKVITDTRYDKFACRVITHTVTVSGSIEQKLLAAIDACLQVTQFQNLDFPGGKLSLTQLIPVASRIVSDTLVKEMEICRKRGGAFSHPDPPERETRGAPTLSTEDRAQKLDTLSSPLAQTPLVLFQSEKSFFELSDPTDAESGGIYSGSTPQSNDIRLPTPKVLTSEGMLAADLQILDT